MWNENIGLLSKRNAQNLPQSTRISNKFVKISKFVHQEQFHFSSEKRHSEIRIIPLFCRSALYFLVFVVVPHCTWAPISPCCLRSCSIARITFPSFRHFCYWTASAADHRWFADRIVGRVTFCMRINVTLFLWFWRQFWKSVLLCLDLRQKVGRGQAFSSPFIRE